jgi:hypothetical protein
MNELIERENIPNHKIQIFPNSFLIRKWYL